MRFRFSSEDAGDKPRRNFSTKFRERTEAPRTFRAGQQETTGRPVRTFASNTNQTTVAGIREIVRDNRRLTSAAFAEDVKTFLCKDSGMSESYCDEIRLSLLNRP